MSVDLPLAQVELLHSRQKDVGDMPPPLETGNIGIGNISTFPHFLYPDGGDFGIIQHALVRHLLIQGDKLRASGAFAALSGANDIAFGTDSERQWLVDCDRLDVLCLIGF